MVASTSVPCQHVVLTYVRRENGSIDFQPTIAHIYKTAEVATRAITRNPAHLAQWVGQSFAVKTYPGTTEITEAEVVA